MVSLIAVQNAVNIVRLIIVIAAVGGLIWWLKKESGVIHSFGFGDGSTFTICSGQSGPDIIKAEYKPISGGSVDVTAAVKNGIKPNYTVDSATLLGSSSPTPGVLFITYRCPAATGSDPRSGFVAGPGQVAFLSSSESVRGSTFLDQGWPARPSLSSLPCS